MSRAHDLDRIAQVLAEHPQLNAGGNGTSNIRTTSDQMAASHAELRTEQGMIDIAEILDWLRAQDLALVKRPGASQPSSYTWKHIAENSMGRYVTNGAFIAAALACGIPVDMRREFNPLVGVSAASVRALKGRP